MISIDELIEMEGFFNSIRLPLDPLALDQCSTITNPPLFVSSHMSIIKVQSGNRRYKPYLGRLIFLREHITKNLK
jgi:hypothetical protein